jgi:hypothetical protein
MRASTRVRGSFPLTVIPGRPDATGRVSGASLGRAIVLTQVVLVTLCAARAGSDWLHGRSTIEGAVALTLVAVFAMWLVAEAIAGATRGAIAEDTRSRSRYRLIEPGVEYRIRH